jgi:hypothetical protein
VDGDGDDWDKLDLLKIDIPTVIVVASDVFEFGHG